jgi:hypothetical protein
VKITSGDSPFSSRVGSVTVCKGEKVEAYIPDIQFRQRDPRFDDQERFKDKKNADAKSCPFSVVDFIYSDTFKGSYSIGYINYRSPI